MISSEARIQDGVVRGIFENGIHQFRGIPYAKASVEELRFAPPCPMDPWQGIYDGTYYRPISPQLSSNLDKPMGTNMQEQGEDCLTLTVTTPEMKGKRPVAVWFHGGANVCGAGSLSWYDGKQLSRRGNMVVVNVNFRLGALGFLIHPAVNEENLSIRDQIQALRWVQDNIRMFGGEPENVTVFGQSAGANAILHMVSLPETRGLFHKMILQSPSIGRANHTKAEAAEIAGKLIEFLGVQCNNAKVIKEELLKKTTAEILEAAKRCEAYFAAKYQGMIFKPVMDSWSTTETTIAAAATEAGKRRMPVIIGTTRDEIYAFSLERDERAERRNREVQAQRYDIPARDFANQAAEAGCQVWKYRFDWGAPDSIYNACHCIELPFVFGDFGAWQDAPFLAGATRQELERLSDVMQSLWCGFIGTGQLDTAVWPRFSRKNQQQKVFDNCSNGVCNI